MPKKLLSITVVLAMCLAMVSAMPLADALGAGGNGSEQSPYLISNAQDLADLANAVNGGESYSGAYFKLENDIDLSTICGLQIGESWTPVGGKFYVDNPEAEGSPQILTAFPFSGIFDGNGHEITGLYINNTSSGDYQGLFGYIDGTVKNLKVVDGSVFGRSYVGGVVGYSDGGVVEECSYSGKVTGKNNGGVVGYNNSGTIEGCSNSGTVSGSYDGGVVGYNNGGTIEGCSNSGTVSGSYDGGIVGYSNQGAIENCSNSGTISGSNAGGVVGYSYNETVDSCFNTGTISGSSLVGGVVGYSVAKGKVTNCYNEGSVTGSGSHTGGTVGEIDNGTVSHCYNKGIVTGTGTLIGGVVGCNHDGGTVEYCYNEGEVRATGRTTVGGVVGHNIGNGATVKNCDNYGTVFGGSDVGGVVGLCESGSNIQVLNCSNSGNVAGPGNNVGGVLGRNAGTNSTVENCYNVANLITGGDRVGGVVGKNEGSGSTVQHTYSSGLVAAVGYDVGGAVGCNDSNATVRDTYYVENIQDLEGIGTDKNTSDKGEEIVKTESAAESVFASGEIAYIMQKPHDENNSGLIWGQRLTTDGDHDNKPILTDNEDYRVLKVTFKNVINADEENSYEEVLAVKYVNPNTVFEVPTEALLASKDGGYILIGWTTDKNGTTAEYRNPTIGEKDGEIGIKEDTVFYAVFVPPTNTSSVVISPRGLTNVYNGVPQYLIDPENPGQADNGTIVYSLDEKGEYLPEIPTATAVGRYTVWYKVIGNSDYSDVGPFPVISYIVEASLGYYPPVGVGGLTYSTDENGEAREQILIDEGKVIAGKGTMVYAVFYEKEITAYSLPSLSDEDFSEDYTTITGTKAGVYRVYYKVIGSEGYVGSDDPNNIPYLTVTINKAKPNVTTPYLTAECGQTLEDVRFPYDEGGYFEWKVDKTTSVGNLAGTVSFPAVYKPYDDTNYMTLDLELYVYVIQPEPKDLEFDPPQAIEKLVYNGDEQVLITAGSVYNNAGVMMYKVEKQRQETTLYLLSADEDGYTTDIRDIFGVEAGVYTVWYKIKGADGYKDLLPQPIEVTIGKAYSVVKTEPKPIDREYDGEMKPLVEEGEAEGGTMVYSLYEDKDFTEKIPEGMGVGTYTVYYKVIGDDNHYGTETYNVTVTISIAGQVMEAPTAKEELEYNGTSQVLINEGRASNGKMLYRLPGVEGYEEYSEDVPKAVNACEYKVYYMVKGDEGYNDIGPDENKYFVIVTIDKADPDPDIPELDATVGQTLADVELPEGFVWDDDTLSVGDVGEKSFAATFTPEDTDNYNTLSLELIVRVTKPEETTTATVMTTEATITTATEAPAPEVTAETSGTTAATATSAPPAVTEGDEEDKNLNTGAALAVVPFVAAAVGAVLSRKRR